MPTDKTDRIITDWCSGTCWQPRGHQSACDLPAKEVPVVEISAEDLRAVYEEPCANPEECPACRERVRGGADADRG